MARSWGTAAAATAATPIPFDPAGGRWRRTRMAPLESEATSPDSAQPAATDGGTTWWLPARRRAAAVWIATVLLAGCTTAGLAWGAGGGPLLWGGAPLGGAGQTPP